MNLKPFLFLIFFSYFIKQKKTFKKYNPIRLLSNLKLINIQNHSNQQKNVPANLFPTHSHKSLNFSPSTFLLSSGFYDLLNRKRQTERK